MARVQTQGAREEQVRILKEANEMRAKIVNDAKEQAQIEVTKVK